MIEPARINDLARRLADVVPSDLKLMKDDLEKTFQGLLQASFSRMNLVTREEFEVQSALLARARELAEKLEVRVSELEQTLAGRPE